ncbi:MAG TPA: hypothetical protein VGA45_10215 [Actinomycetota bacterium]
MPYWTLSRLEAAVARLLVATGRRVARRPGAEAGFSTAEGLAGAALAVVALIAIWAAMRAFGVNLIHWMQDQITSSGGGTGGP